MFHVYMDDSIREPSDVYVAAFVVAADRVDAAETILREAKGGVGVPPTEPIHWRVLFNKDARGRSAWAQVNPAKIWGMLEGLCRALGPIQEQPYIAVLRSNQFGRPAAEKPGASLDSNGFASLGY
jgi:hypothetical protein